MCSVAESGIVNNRLSQPFGGANALSPVSGKSSHAAIDTEALSYAAGKNRDPRDPQWPMARKAPVVAPPVVYTNWAQGFGSWIDRDADGNAAASTSTTGGVLSGIDATINGTWRIGLAAGYSQTEVRVGDRGSSLETDSYHISGYAGARQGDFGANFGAVYSWNDISSTRNVAFPGFAETLKAGYDAGSAQVFGELNYRFLAGPAAFESFAGLNYINHHTNRFGETGGNAALAFAAQDRDVTFSTLGLRSSAFLGESDGNTFIARGTVGWRHAFGDVGTDLSAAFAGGLPFTVTGTPIAVDALLAEAGVDMNIRKDVTLGLSWSGQFGDGATENRLRGQLVYRW